MTVNQFMIKSGIPASLKGFEVVKRAIELFVEIPELTITRAYGILSNEFDITTHSIERRMNLAIQQGLQFMDEDLRDMIFSGRDKVPTGEYVKSVACYIRNNLI